MMHINLFVALAKTGISGGAVVAERIRQRIAAQGITHNWQNFSLTAQLWRWCLS